MEIKLPKQRLVIDADVQKEWPLVYHFNEKKEKVSDMSISEGHIKIELAGDITIRVKNVTELLKITKKMSELKAIRREKCRRIVYDSIE